MIARITYEDAAFGRVTATLAEDATWTADDRAMATALNALAASEDRSPARGDWLTWHAERMAALLDGEVAVASKTVPAEAGIRY